MSESKMRLESPAVSLKLIVVNGKTVVTDFSNSDDSPEVFFQNTSGSIHFNVSSRKLFFIFK